MSDLCPRCRSPLRLFREWDTVEIGCLACAWRRYEPLDRTPPKREPRRCTRKLKGVAA